MYTYYCYECSEYFTSKKNNSFVKCVNCKSEDTEYCPEEDIATEVLKKDAEYSDEDDSKDAKLNNISFYNEDNDIDDLIASEKYLFDPGYDEDSESEDSELEDSDLENTESEAEDELC